MGKSRWAVLVVGVCLVVTAVAIAYAAGKSTAVPVQEVVRAKAFELVGAKGTYARLSACEENVGVKVSLLDAKGAVRGSLFFGNASNAPQPGGAVYLQVTGKERSGEHAGLILLQVTEEGRPEVIGCEGLRRPFFLTVNDDGVGELRMPGERELRITTVGGGFMRIYDKGNEKVLWQAP